MEIQSLIVSGMELVGTIAFAASGAMVGIHCRMDVFGNVPGALTNPVYVAAAVVTALVLFAVLYFKVNVLQGRIGIVYDKVMLVMDSTGLGIFTAAGVITGINAGYIGDIFLLTVLGTLTGVGGGLLRDVMAGQPPYIFVKHVYACASVTGAVCCVWVYRLFGQVPAMFIASGVVMAIRFLAAHFRWNLPHVSWERKKRL